jgi:bifunctional DNA-binding transcriptional regulator/antitoxin component of YhaV-PrlF toxin-antitoxin module
MHVRVTDEGQLKIPQQIQQQLGIGPGSWLDIDADDGVIRASVIQPPRGETVIPSGRGLAGYRGRRLTVEEMDPVRALESEDGDRA